MANLKYHLRGMLLSSLGYGFGFAIGNFGSHLLLKSGFLEPIRDLFAAQRFELGLTLLLLVIGVGGAIGGAIGGLALSYTHQSTRRLRYVWPSALGFGVSYALILFPLTLAISLFSFYSPAQASPLGFVVVVGLAGAIFGAVSGLVLGLLTVGRATWRVFLVSAIAFAAGGAGLGQGLYFHFFAEARAWSIFGALFSFWGDRRRWAGFSVQLAGPSPARHKAGAFVQVCRLVQRLKSSVQGCDRGTFADGPAGATQTVGDNPFQSPERLADHRSRIANHWHPLVVANRHVNGFFGGRGADAAAGPVCG